jgi:hypothetical protein
MLSSQAGWTLGRVVVAAVAVVSVIAACRTFRESRATALARPGAFTA